MQNLIDSIEILDASNQPLSYEYREKLWKFYTQIQLQPIELNMGGFYTVNYQLLGAVKWMKFIEWFDQKLVSDFHWSHLVSNNSCAIRKFLKFQ